MKELRHEEMMITRNDPPAPSTSTGIGTIGLQASKGSGKYRDKGGTVMIKQSLPTNNDGSAHHLKQIMAGSIGLQQRKCHKKRDSRRKNKQKNHSSEGQYSFKDRVIKETCEVRDRHNSQIRIYGRKREMARLKHMQRKRIPLRKEFPESSRRLTRMEQVEKYVEGTFHTLVSSKGKEAITWWEEELKDKDKGK